MNTAPVLFTPLASFMHLKRMTDDNGTFEHADHASPRRQHGYCTDDMARLLVVASREPAGSQVVDELGKIALRFVVDAQGPEGDICNRRDSRGRWHGPRSVEDCWGRSLWGLGTAAARSPYELTRRVALAHFERGALQRSPWPRAMAFACLGASEVVAGRPEHDGALYLMADVAELLTESTSTGWAWPEPRLSYANAVIPEAFMAAGVALDRPGLVDRGFELLEWLVGHETIDGHFSVTPAGGSGPGDKRPAFDQQPIELAALADACARAADVRPGDNWQECVWRAIAWFHGDNDSQVPMRDELSGGGFDGLRCDGANLNQGAESTIALISTIQHGLNVGEAGRAT